MNQQHIALQRVSLGALIIALTLLVDDAMTTVDATQRRLAAGDAPDAAASFAYRTLAAQIGLAAQIHYLPVSALAGDNIVAASAHTPWYRGLPLLPLLESLPVERSRAAGLSAHFPVQRVARQDGSSSDDFRGYQGRLEAGRLSVGDEIRVQPSGKSARIATIYTPQGEARSAEAGSALTLTLDSDVDISRGDSILAADNPALPTRHRSWPGTLWPAIA